VLVIGGGSVSSDVALSLRRAGTTEVRLVCLEAAGEMLALDSEVAEMLEQGVVIENGWGPLALTSPSSLGFARCTRVKDEAGRFSPLLDEAGRSSCWPWDRSWTRRWRATWRRSLGATGWSRWTARP